MFVKRLFAQLNNASPYLLSSKKWNLPSVGLTAQYNNFRRPRIRKLQNLNDSRISDLDTERKVKELLERTCPKELTAEDWRNLKDSYQHVQAARSFITTLTNKKLYGEGKAFIDMLHKYEPQFITPFTEVLILKFLTVCVNKRSIVDEEYIVNAYERIIKQCPILDSSSRAILILAMQSTSEWQQALTLVNATDEVYEMNPRVYSAIILNLLKNNNVDTAWEFIDKMKENYINPSNACWIEWLQLCRRKGLTAWENGVGRMLDHFHEHHIQMSITLAENVVTFIEEFNPEYVAVKTDIRTHGECARCLSKLETIFSESDHNALKEMVEMIFQKNGSLFASTTPIEMERFQSIITKCSKYNFVLDGLNILLGKTVNITTFIKNLKRCHNARIFFLGREHLARREVFAWIKQHVAYAFLCDDESLDDAFILYASIYHRPDVKFVSNDQFRSQLALLKNDKRRNLFIRWRYLNQMDPKMLTCRFYLSEIHKSNNGDFHIPCVAAPSTSLLWQPVVPEYWLCIQRSHQEKLTEKTASQRKFPSPNEKPFRNEETKTSSIGTLFENTFQADDPRKLSIKKRFERINQKTKKKKYVHEAPSQQPSDEEKK